MTDELYHYGVLGMKCGVKRNPGAAYTKATSKSSRLVNQYINKSSRDNNWNKKISKAFKNADVSKIDNSVVDAGRKTVNEFNKTVLNTNDPKISKGRELMRNVI